MLVLEAELYHAARYKSRLDRVDSVPGTVSHNSHSNMKIFPVPFLINLLKPAGHVILQQFNIQQLYALPTLYLCVLYLSENKQRLVPLTA